MAVAWTCGCRYNATATWIRTSGRHYALITSGRSHFSLLPSLIGLVAQERGVISRRERSAVKRPPKMMHILSSTVLPANNGGEHRKANIPINYGLFDDEALGPRERGQANFYNEHIYAGGKLAAAFSRRITPSNSVGKNVSVMELRSMMDRGRGDEVVDYISELRRQQISIPTGVLNNVLRYLLCHSIRDAKQVFKIYQQTTMVNAMTYEFYIEGLLQNDDLDAAMDVFRQIKERKILGSLQLHNHLLSSILLSNVGAKKWDLANEVLDGINNSNIKPDISTFNLLMEIASNDSNDPSTACLQLLHEMKTINVPPSLGSYTILLQCLRKVETHETRNSLLFNILDELINKRISLKIITKHDQMFFDECMSAASRSSVSNFFVKSLFKFVQEKDEWRTLIEPSTFYSDYLGGLAATNFIRDEQKSYFKLLLQEYFELVPSYFIPTPITYKRIFAAMHHNNDISLLPDLYADFSQYHLSSFSQENTITENGVPIQVIDAMFLAMKYCTIPNTHLKEYADIAVEADNLVGNKSKSRTSLIIKLLCLCGDLSRARHKVEESQQLAIEITPEALKLYEELCANSPSTPSTSPSAVPVSELLDLLSGL